jgi:hypothetical protein
MKNSSIVPIEQNGTIFSFSPDGNVAIQGPIPHYDALDIARCLAADIFCTDKRTELTKDEFSFWQNVRRPHGRDFYGKDY